MMVRDSGCFILAGSGVGPYDNQGSQLSHG